MTLENERFCVIDIETTGLNTKKDEIIAIAALPVEGFKVKFSEHLFTLVRAERFEPKSVRYQGITMSDLKDAPAFEDVAPKLLDLISNSIVVGYATYIDVEFLKRAFKKKLGVKLKVERYIDIAELEVWLIRKRGMAVTFRLDFDSLLKMYRIGDGIRHSALGDAYATALIFLKQLSQLADYGLGVVDLVRIGRRLML